MILILKLRIYDPKERLPKLLNVEGSGSRIFNSRQCIIYWRWQNHPNQLEEPRLGRYCQHSGMPEKFWQIDGISGATIILGWGYTKNLKP